MLARCAAVGRVGALARGASFVTPMQTFSTYYTKEHEYAQVDGKVATCGVTNYAQEQLGDIVYVSLPEVGDVVEQGAPVSTVESVKAASDVYATVSGTVLEVNSALDADPSEVNTAPETTGWFVKIEMTQEGDLANLMSQEDYDAFLETCD